MSKIRAGCLALILPGRYTMPSAGRTVKVLRLGAESDRWVSKEKPRMVITLRPPYPNGVPWVISPIGGDLKYSIKWNGEVDLYTFSMVGIHENFLMPLDDPESIDEEESTERHEPAGIS